MQVLLPFLPMAAMRFPAILLNTISTTMKNQAGSVLVNGEASPQFQINNGGKQGDPLFPLLYVIAMEGLVALLQSHPRYMGISTPDGEEYVTSIGYADDTVVLEVRPID